MLLGCIMLQYSIITIYGAGNKTCHENILYFYISTFRKMRAVPNMAVPFTVIISHLPVSTMLRYFRNEFEMVPFATVATFVSTFHICCISILRPLYFQKFRLLDHTSVSFQSPYLLTDMFLS